MNDAVDRQFVVWRNRALTAERILLDILKANDEFRSGMPDDWEGDPLQDGCEAARTHLNAIGIIMGPEKPAEVKP